MNATPPPPPAKRVIAELSPWQKWLAWWRLPRGGAFCFPCGAEIIESDDDACVCIQCGGRNRRRKLRINDNGPPPSGPRPEPSRPPPPTRNFSAPESGLTKVAEPVAQPLRGRISRVSVLPRGKVSVVMHFDLVDGDRARSLTPDTVLEVAEVRGK
jgi:hypothetical protein